MEGDDLLVEDEFVQFLSSADDGCGQPELFCRAQGHNVSVHRVGSPKSAVAYWSFPTESLITACTTAFFQKALDGFPVVLIGLDFDENHFLCCIDVASSGRLLVALQLPYSIRCITALLDRDCETGIAIAAQTVVQSSKQSCFVGTDFGHLYLVDVGLEDRQMVCTLENALQPHESITPPQGYYACVDLLSALHSQRQFLWSVDDYRTSIQLSDMSVTVVEVFGNAGIVCVGFHMGVYMLISLNTLDPIFTSPYPGSLQGPVVTFCVQEPENDPKSILYLWVGRDALMQDDNIVLPAELEMVDLQYEGKRLNGSLVVYEGLQCSQKRMFWKPTNCLALLSCVVVRRPALSCLPDDSDLIRGDDDSSVCMTSWLDTWNTVQCTVFDLNAWYHAHMPAAVRCVSRKDNQCPYLADVHVNTKQLFKGSAAVYVSPTVVRFPFWTNSDCDMSFYACSYKFWCVVATMDQCLHLQAPSLQEMRLSDLVGCGVEGLMQRPASICMKLKDIDIINEIPDNHEGKCATLATILLHHGYCSEMKDLFAKCGQEQIGGYRNWLWATFTDCKNSFDTNASPLFDHSECVSERQAASLHHSFAILQSIGLLHAALLQAAHNSTAMTDESKQELEAQGDAMSLVLDYCRMCMWMYDKGVLPATTKHALGIKMIDRLNSQRKSDGRTLCIDRFLDGIAKSGACDPWQRNGNGSLYPPPSMLSLLSLNLLEHCQESTKIAVVYYFLLDVQHIAKGKTGFLKADLSKLPHLFAAEFLTPLDLSLEEGILKEWKEDSLVEKKLEKMDSDGNDCDLWLKRLHMLEDRQNVEKIVQDKYSVLNLPLDQGKERTLKERLVHSFEDANLYNLRLLSSMRYRDAISLSAELNKVDERGSQNPSQLVMEKIQKILPPKIGKRAGKSVDILRPQPTKSISKPVFAKVTAKVSQKSRLDKLKVLTEENIATQAYSPLKKPGPPMTPSRLPDKTLEKMATPSQSRKALVGRYSYIQNILTTPLTLPRRTPKPSTSKKTAHTPSILKTTTAVENADKVMEQQDIDTTMSKQLRFDLPDSPEKEQSPPATPVEQRTDSNKGDVCPAGPSSVSSLGSTDMELASTSSKSTVGHREQRVCMSTSVRTAANVTTGSMMMDLSSPDDYMSDDSFVDNSDITSSKFVTYMSKQTDKSVYSVESMHISPQEEVVSPITDDSVFEKDNSEAKDVDSPPIAEVKPVAIEPIVDAESSVDASGAVVLEDTQEETIIENEMVQQPPLPTIVEEVAEAKKETDDIEGGEKKEVDEVEGGDKKRISPVADLVRPPLRARSKTPERSASDSSKYNLRERTPQISPKRTRNGSISASERKSPSRRTKRAASEVKEIPRDSVSSGRKTGRTRAASESRDTEKDSKQTPIRIRQATSLLGDAAPIASRTRASPSRTILASPERKSVVLTRKAIGSSGSLESHVADDNHKKASPPKKNEEASPVRKSVTPPSKRNSPTISKKEISPPKKLNEESSSPSQSSSTSSSVYRFRNRSPIPSIPEESEPSPKFSEPPPTPVIVPRKTRLKSGRRSVVSASSNIPLKPSSKTRKSMPAAVSKADDAIKPYLRRRMTEVARREETVVEPVEEEGQDTKQDHVDDDNKEKDESTLSGKSDFGSKFSSLAPVPEDDTIDVAGDEMSSAPTPKIVRRKSRIISGRLAVKRAVKRLSCSPQKQVGVGNLPPKRRASEFVFSPPEPVNSEQQEKDGVQEECSSVDMSTYPFSPPLLRSRTPPRIPPSKKTRLAVRFK